MGLIITGMHRSGTSAVARVVDGLGLLAGDERMPAAPENPRGFFERRDVMDFNDRWLTSLGGAWWAPPRVSATTWSALDTTTLNADRELLDVFDPSAAAWYVKDPRISLLLPLWDRLSLQSLPAIVCIRDPRDVVMSLQLRNGMGAGRGLALWYAYVRESILASASRPLLVVDYSQLLSATSATVEAIVDFVARHGGGEGHFRSLDELVALVEPQLQRNQQSTVDGLPTSALDEAVESYRRLAKAHLVLSATPDVPELPGWCAETLTEALHVSDVERRAQATTVRVRLLEEQAAEQERMLGDLRRETEAGHVAREVSSRSTALLEARDVELSEARLSLAKAREQLAERESALITERQALTAQVTAYQHEIATLIAQRSEARVELGAVSAERARLTSMLGEVRDQAGVLGEEWQSLRAILGLTQQRLEDVEARLEHALLDAGVMQRERADYSAELTRANAMLVTRAEALDSLTQALERARAATHRAQTRLTSAEAHVASGGQSRERLEAALAVERAQRVRLSDALRAAILHGQVVSGEVELLRASRSFRYGRRLTAPVRVFRRRPDSEPQAETEHQ